MNDQCVQALVNTCFSTKIRSNMYRYTRKCFTLRQQIKYSARLKHVSSHSNFVVPEITKTMGKSTLSSITDSICIHLEILSYKYYQHFWLCHHERCLRRTETWLGHNLHLTAQHMESAQLNVHTF